MAGNHVEFLQKYLNDQKYQSMRAINSANKKETTNQAGIRVPCEQLIPGWFPQRSQNERTKISAVVKRKSSLRSVTLTSTMMTRNKKGSKNCVASSQLAHPAQKKWKTAGEKKLMVVTVNPPMKVSKSSKNTRKSCHPVATAPLLDMSKEAESPAAVADVSQAELWKNKVSALEEQLNSSKDALRESNSQLQIAEKKIAELKDRSVSSAVPTTSSCPKETEIVEAVVKSLPVGSSITINFNLNNSPAISDDTRQKTWHRQNAMKTGVFSGRGRHYRSKRKPRSLRKPREGAPIN